MELHLIASIPQVGGGARHLFVADAEAARAARSELRSDPAMIEAIGADYIVESALGEPLVCWRSPGKCISRPEWAAIHAALDGGDE